MAFTLPDLPYAHNALEPSIDGKTMEIHHGKHHQAYVNKLNDAIKGHANLESMSIEALCSGISQVPADIRGAVRNNGGGHFNHTLFWKIMQPGGSGEPTGELGDAIASVFGSLADFKSRFTDAAANRFGSGWAWLFVKNGRLELDSSPNQDSPIMDGGKPMIVELAGGLGAPAGDCPPSLPTPARFRNRTGADKWGIPLPMHGRLTLQDLAEEHAKLVKRIAVEWPASGGPSTGFVPLPLPTSQRD